MRLLLDTHALIWWLAGNVSLTVKARRAIDQEASAIFVSAATAWEVATKYRLGKLPAAAQLMGRFSEVLSEQNFLELPVTLAHGEKAGSMPGPHRDPFDRMIMAQAIFENLILVSNERLFDAFGVKRLW